VKDDFYLLVELGETNTKQNQQKSKEKKGLS